MKCISTLVVSLPLALAACGGGGSDCEKAIDKGMKMATEMASAMGGEEAKAQMAEMKKEMAKKKPEAIKKCEAAIKDNPEAKKAVKCVANAKDMAAMMKCEGADSLKGLM